MIIKAASLALRDISSRPFRGVLLKSLALTIGLLFLLWSGLAWLAAVLVAIPYPWLDTAFAFLTGIGVVVGLGFLVAPVMAVFADFFLDQIAERVEKTHYAGEPSGRALPLIHSAATSLRFLVSVLLVNAVALLLVVFIGLGFVIFLGANAYLLGREYFELAALRYYDIATVVALRRRHANRIFAAGLIIAGFAAVPFVNLLAPLFATAFMLHLQMRLAALERLPGGLLSR